jgi:carboxypeptidase PM20D1
MLSFTLRTTISALVLLAVPAVAADAVPSAKDILVHSVSVPTVAGRGKVPELAAYYGNALKAAGYTDADIVFTPVGETGFLSVTLKGKASSAPIILIGHMDVVEAKAADWTRDPFTGGGGEHALWPWRGGQ